MRKRVTPEDVKNFHALYEKHGTYAEVARRTGFSASTIRRYVEDPVALLLVERWENQPTALHLTVENEAIVVKEEG